MACTLSSLKIYSTSTLSAEVVTDCWGNKIQIIYGLLVTSNLKASWLLWQAPSESVGFRISNLRCYTGPLRFRLLFRIRWVGHSFVSQAQGMVQFSASYHISGPRTNNWVPYVNVLAPENHQSYHIKSNSADMDIRFCVIAESCYVWVKDSRHPHLFLWSHARSE